MFLQTLKAPFSKDQFFSEESTRLFCTDFDPVQYSYFTLKICLFLSNYPTFHDISVKLFSLTFFFPISKETNLLPNLRERERGDWKVYWSEWCQVLLGNKSLLLSCLWLSFCEDGDHRLGNGTPWERRQVSLQRGKSLHWEAWRRKQETQVKIWRAIKWIRSPGLVEGHTAF